MANAPEPPQNLSKLEKDALAFSKRAVDVVAAAIKEGIPPHHVLAGMVLATASLTDRDWREPVPEEIQAFNRACQTLFSALAEAHLFMEMERKGHWPQTHSAQKP